MPNKKTAKLPASTVKLLRQIEQLILNEPSKFDMGHFGAAWKKDVPNYQGPVCGTQACIAGWAVLLTKPRTHSGLQREAQQKGKAYLELFVRADVDALGCTALGLTQEQGDRLFYSFPDLGGGVGWPRQFSEAYRGFITESFEAACIAVARIEHFIATNGAE